ncbi:MAG TPA: TetR family transcriptional regulator [Solirubrobacteraceae bacterium]
MDQGVTTDEERPSADPSAPRERVLAAAFIEFAVHGIAGARIDRIAKAAKTSKERVYVYFRSKDEIYAAVIAEQIRVFLDAVTLDPHDIPRYVGELFDFNVAHPELMRLIAWSRLENTGPPSPEANDVLAAKVQAIGIAQADGLIPDDIPALDILILLTELAGGWLSSTEFHVHAATGDSKAVAERRTAAVKIASRLFPPTR